MGSFRGVNWNLNSTNQSYYDKIMKDPQYFEGVKNLKFHIEQMTPEEYLDRIQTDIFKTTAATIQTRLSQNLVSEYQEAMQRGDRFPIPYLDYVRELQEGHHRVQAAKELGETKIPVMVVKRARYSIPERSPLWEDGAFSDRQSQHPAV